MDDGLYDEATEQRIDRRSRRRGVPRAPLGARAAGTGALLTAIALGLQEVFDPRERDEIILEVDTAGEPHDDRPVTLDYDPVSVARSRAHVRPWLLPTSA